MTTAPPLTFTHIREWMPLPCNLIFLGITHFYKRMLTTLIYFRGSQKLYYINNYILGVVLLQGLLGVNDDSANLKVRMHIVRNTKRLNLSIFNLHIITQMDISQLSYILRRNTTLWIKKETNLIRILLAMRIWEVDDLLPNLVPAVVLRVLIRIQQALLHIQPPEQPMTTFITTLVRQCRNCQNIFTE